MKNATVMLAGLLLGVGCGGGADAEMESGRAGTAGAEVGMEGQMEGQEERLTFRENGSGEVEVEDVVLRTDPESAESQLIFFRDDVDCTAVTETPVGDDRLVAMVEIEPGTDGLPTPGRLPPAVWTYRVDGETQQGEGGEGWVQITRVPTTERVEGTVTVATMIDDDRVELSGPFTARVCEVSASAVPSLSVR